MAVSPFLAFNSKLLDSSHMLLAELARVMMAQELAAPHAVVPDGLGAEEPPWSCLCRTAAQRGTKPSSATA